MEHFKTGILSNRAQGILSSLNHSLKKCSEKGSEEKWGWEILFKDDKFLTLSYFIKSANILESLFLETLTQMALGRDLYFLQQLSFRECENFLRDENHLPVFGDFGIFSPKDTFKLVKNSLILAFLLKEIKENEAEGLYFRGWKILTLVEKNRQANTFIKVLNNHFSRGNLLKLALAETEKIAIFTNGFPIEIEVIEELIHKLSDHAEEISSLKVVAVQ